MLQLWQANFSVPLYSSPGGDGLYGLAAIKGIIEHGWYLTNSSLGAPGGQRLYDYPVFSGDSLYLLIVKVIGIPFSNPAVVDNLFFLLCFPLIAVSAYAGLRVVGISIGPSVVCAVLFTLLPYHFFDGESHIFQGSYFTVPLACLLVIAVLSGRALFTRSATEEGCAEVSDVALRRDRAGLRRRGLLGQLLRRLHRGPGAAGGSGDASSPTAVSAEWRVGPRSPPSCSPR